MLIQSLLMPLTGIVIVPYPARNLPPQPGFLDKICDRSIIWPVPAPLPIQTNASWLVTPCRKVNSKFTSYTDSTLCTTMAVAAPPPLQMAATPYSPGFSWCSRVVRIREPELPNA